MRLRSIVTGLLPVVLIALLSAQDAQAQLGSRLKRAAQSAAERELAERTARLVRDAIRCAIDDPECFGTAEADGKEVIFTDGNGEIITGEDGVPVTDREAAAETAGVELQAAQPKPGEGAWANYDFVPGETVLYYEDYENDKVGDFPRRMEFMQGNWEIVEWEGRRLLRNTGPRGSALKINLPRELPERYTIELEAYYSYGNQRFIVSTAEPPEGRGWGLLTDNFFQLGVAHGTGVTRRGNTGVESMNPSPELTDELVPVRIMVDGSYAKVYVNERRVANVPNAVLPRTNLIYIENVYNASADQPMYLGSVRVAEGGVDLYDKLAEEGRVATHGILFAVNSATIRPESTPTLDEIGTMLQEHTDLRLRIEGHTDASGDDASNLDLSERRAAAVRDFLAEAYGIDADRLDVQGLGETAPIDDNETPEGRQNNRRVELVRLDG